MTTPKVAKTKVSKPNIYSISNLRLVHSPLKTAHSNTPHMSTSRCGNICIMPPKCSRKERRRGFSNRSSVEAALSGRSCVFLCESKSTLFGLLKVDAIRNHWLRFVYNTTAQPKCSNLCNAFYGRLFCEFSRVQGWLCMKVIKKISYFTVTIWRFWISHCMFCY